jgi:hypothetical protein
MTDSRPLPQYGEYATPDEQARAMGLDPNAPVAGAALPAPDPGTRISSTPSVAAPAQTGFANRVFTVFFLGLGGFMLIGSIPGYFSFVSTYTQSLKLSARLLGVPAVSAPASLAPAGIWILVVNIVLYVLTILWASWALRRGRAAAYIPIVGFVVFVAIMGIIINGFAPGLFTQLAQ